MNWGWDVKVLLTVDRGLDERFLNDFERKLMGGGGGVSDGA